MSYHALGVLLEGLFARLNAANVVPSPDEVWADCIQDIHNLLELNEIRNEFTDLGNGIQLPKALEAARLLQNLRQRFDADGRTNPLVGRIRAAVVEKQRPTRNVDRATIQGVGSDIVRLTPESFTHFSRFQVEGWQRVFNTINNREGIVVVAPTGSGKTEVFLMPVIYAIAQSIRHNPRNPHRFVLLYPRVALLKDQLARIFRYVHHAEQATLTTGQLSLLGTHSVEQGIVIGFQFGGICANASETLDNRDVFEEDGTFRIVEQCPICNQGKLKVDRDRRSNRYRSRNVPSGVTILYCDNPTCGNGSEFRVSIAKNDHAITRPHILVTTAESLDRLYLNPKPDFENYLRQLTGIVFDEVHLYYSIYGVHIHNLVNRLEEWQNGHSLAKIASSATISDPQRFAANFFYGNSNEFVLVHDASDYEQEPAGLEVLYFLQSPEGRTNAGAAPTLIQSVMAMGHGVLGNDDRAIVFSDSLDMAGRLTAQIQDAEENKRLWEFRTISDAIRFQNITCPGTPPSECPIYLAGECWRGILGNQNCFELINAIREVPLIIRAVSSKQQNDYRDGDIIVATPTLEVGVDDPQIKSTIHYLPPRTVFSFIQKRGRAGRASGEIAYTLMLLDTTPSSQFYFFRRNRLINGSYELPLNPENEVVRGMHNLIQRERERMGQCFQDAPRNNAIQGIWRWVWETLNRCHILRRYYAQQLAALDSYPRSSQDQGHVRRTLRDWIQREKQLLGNYLSLEQLLQKIQEESPDELHNTVQEVINDVNNFMSHQGMSADDVRLQLRRLDLELGGIYYNDETNQEILEQITEIQKTVRDTWVSLSRQQAWQIELRHVECLYDFFRVLERLCEPRILNMAPDVLKIVLQAMFYLHLGLNETDMPEAYQSQIEYYSYYLPDAYFQTVKPIIIEARYFIVSRPNSDLYQESLTELSTTFIPYKTVYRYRPSPESRPNPNISYLTVLSLEHRPDWVNDELQTVNIRLRSEGVTRGGIQFPKKVYVHFIESDPEGQQIVTFCPQCYAIHNFRNRRCNCHQELQRVKLYAEPIVERSYEALVEPRQITRSLSIIEQMRGTTTVRGSSVEARRVFWDAQVRYYRYIANVRPYTFNALYDAPIQYGIPTKGITWNLAGVVEQILQDNNLRQQVERIVINGTHKELNEELVLHTASHLLHRAIAAISGVNEQELEYSFQETTPDNPPQVVVWERYEGGAGVSEVFENTLRTNPVEVYQELLASVLCPIDLAEAPNWTSVEQLRSELAQCWCLPEDNELIVRVVEEAEAEHRIRDRQQEEEDRMMCRPPQGHDGCPACLHTTYCTERDNQDLSVSRLVGEALVRCLVRRLNQGENEALIEEAISQNLTLPPTLMADTAQGIFDVLLL
jgi:superfamily II DNA or RNA helicase